MFRNGGSEYAINGEPCRLLDVQELLSDSGIGREMHVIVGQGQLDPSCIATPEDRRGFIEEAAGVLKHRKRKEKALRKLEAMQANLTRLADLTAELRRQLKPLGRQAEVARRAAVVQADLRDARLRLLADDLLDAARPRWSRRSPTRRRCASAGRTSRPRWPRAQQREAELEAATAERAPAARPRPGDLVPAVRRARAAARHRGPGRAAAAHPGRASPRTTARAATPRSWRPTAAEVRAEEAALAG